MRRMTAMSSRSPMSPAIRGTSIRLRSSASNACSAGTSERRSGSGFPAPVMPITLVPVAAILVASIRLNFLGPCTDVRRGGPRTTQLDVPLAKGEEMGWFQHGSTIIVFAPHGFTLAEGIRQGPESASESRSCDCLPLHPPSAGDAACQISTWLPSSTTRPGGRRKYSVADPDSRTIAANSASCHSGMPGRAAGTRICRPRT